MYKRKILIGLYLFISPTIVTIAQLSVLTFPEFDPLMGVPASPYPEVFFPPIVYGGLVLLFGHFLNKIRESIEKNYFLSKYIKPIWISLSLLYSLIFWISTMFSQRAVIMHYLNATNANGFHFLGRILPPILPEVFPNTAYLPYYIALITGVFGVLLILVNSILVLRSRPEHKMEV